MDPLHGAITTKYLVRIWPTAAQPPEMQQSEMRSPESVTDGHAGNDRAEIRSIRQWAQSNANVEGTPYSFEVLRDSTVATLSGSGGTRRVVEQIATGTVEPTKPTTPE